jgi:carnitine O-acetyltransferase
MPTSTLPVRHFRMPKSLNEALVSEPKITSIDEFSQDQRDPLSAHVQRYKRGITFAHQDKLAKLPIPDLESSVEKYLIALKPLQSPRDHAESRRAAEEFLRNDGPELQEKLKKYASDKTSYIEQFCKRFPGE